MGYCINFCSLFFWQERYWLGFGYFDYLSLIWWLCSWVALRWSWCLSWMKGQNVTFWHNTDTHHLENTRVYELSLPAKSGYCVCAYTTNQSASIPIINEWVTSTPQSLTRFSVYKDRHRQLSCWLNNKLVTSHAVRSGLSPVLKTADIISKTLNMNNFAAIWARKFCII